MEQVIVFTGDVWCRSLKGFCWQDVWPDFSGTYSSVFRLLLLPMWTARSPTFLYHTVNLFHLLPLLNNHTGVRGSQVWTVVYMDCTAIAGT